MIKVELPAKMVLFLIEAVDYRIAAHSTQIASGLLNEDDSADASNDRALLMSINGELRHKEKEWRGAPAPLGDMRARGKLKLIMQCLLTDGFSEAEQDALIKMGRETSPDPSWTDYLYWPVKYGLDGSVDAALDRVFSYQPIIL
jgi:hypothetical protein